MFTLMHTDVIRIQVYVPQDEAFGVEPGVDAVVRVPEIPGRDFPGTVTRIADALQPGTRTLLTEIDVPNPDGALTPGIYCTVELVDPAQDALDDHSGRSGGVRSGRPARRGGRERRAAHSQRSRSRGTSARRSRCTTASSGRSGHPQSDGRPDRRQQGRRSRTGEEIAADAMPPDLDRFGLNALTPQRSDQSDLITPQGGFRRA